MDRPCIRRLVTGREEALEQRRGHAIPNSHAMDTSTVDGSALIINGFGSVSRDPQWCEDQKWFQTRFEKECLLGPLHRVPKCDICHRFRKTAPFQVMVDGQYDVVWEDKDGKVNREWHAWEEPVWLHLCDGCWYGVWDETVRCGRSRHDRDFEDDLHGTAAKARSKDEENVDFFKHLQMLGRSKLQREGWTLNTWTGVLVKGRGGTEGRSV